MHNKLSQRSEIAVLLTVRHHSKRLFFTVHEYFHAMDYQMDYIFVFLLTGIGFVVGNFILSSLLRPYRPTAKKLSTYECGEEPVGEAWIQYNVRYYLFTMIFVIFDVEALFLIPWAVVYQTLGTFTFIEMTIFLVLLAVGLIHVWRKGALKWA